MNQPEAEDEVYFRGETPRSDGGIADDDDESGSSPGRYSESDVDIDGITNTPPPPPPLYQASVIVVGSTKAGKTCLIRALTKQAFKKTYQETSISHNRIEYEHVDPSVLTIVYNSLFDQNSSSEKPKTPQDCHDVSPTCLKNKKMKNLRMDKVMLEFIDISGAKDHTTERQIHSKNVDAIIFVYDISNPQSLDEIRDTFYFEACRIKYETPLTTPHVLVGTKLDLFQQETEFIVRDISYVGQDKSMLYGTNFNCWSIQTSAKTGAGISDLRDYLLSLVISNTPRTDSSKAQTKKSRLQKILKCILQ